MCKKINCPFCGEFLGDVSDMDECPICGREFIRDYLDEE